MSLRIWIILVLLIIPAQAAAQRHAVDRGAFRLSGGISYTHSNLTEDRSISVLSFAPTAMFFTTDNFALGGTLQITHINECFSFESPFDEFPDLTVDASVTRIGIGPQIAYFFGSRKSTMFPFFSFGFLFTGSDEDSDPDFITIRPSAGIAFLIAKNVSIDGELFFSFQDEVSGTGNDLSVTMFGLAAGVGVFIF